MGEAAGALQTAAAQPAARALAFGAKELSADTPTDGRPQQTAAPKFVERSAPAPLDEPQTPGAAAAERVAVELTM